MWLQDRGTCQVHHAFTSSSASGSSEATWILSEQQWKQQLWVIRPRTHFKSLKASLVGPAEASCLFLQRGEFYLDILQVAAKRLMVGRCLDSLMFLFPATLKAVAVLKVPLL